MHFGNSLASHLLEEARAQVLEQYLGFHKVAYVQLWWQLQVALLTTCP